jgi:hypothetical protein
VFGGLNRLLAAAVVAGAALTAVLAAPSAALACNSGTSAVNVYRECQQNGGGGTPTGGGPSSTRLPVSGPIAKALSHAGKDRSALSRLVSSYGLRRHLQGSQSGPGTAPSSVGSAFDLGDGPTALLIALAGTAFLLLSGSGVRVWRNRHRAVPR